MSFFSQLAAAAASSLVNSLTSSSSTTDPLKVIEISSSLLVSRSILKREQCLVVYGNGVGFEGYELTMAMSMSGGRDKVYRYFFFNLRI